MDVTMEERVERFRKRLQNGATFSVTKTSEFGWRLVSGKLAIDFVFDRYGNGTYTIMVSDSRIPGSAVNLNGLRHVRSARNVLADGGSPENFAELFNTYFSDLLAGDMSLLEQYEPLRDDIADYSLTALGLDDDDPVKIKFRAWDISWLDDLKKRNG